jgi:hypothetical protein
MYGLKPVPFRDRIWRVYQYIFCVSGFRFEALYLCFELCV